MDTRGNERCGHRHGCGAGRAIGTVTRIVPVGMAKPARTSIRSCLVIGMAVLTGCGQASMGRAFDAGSHRDVVAHDVMIDVRGRKMHLRIYPGGETTVLLESGSGYGADEWNNVAPALARETRATVIAYDRAGMGTSEGLDTPYEVHEEVGRLHAALYELGHHRQVVLVGHSYGGFLIQLYANLYPEAVLGLVYVDANTVWGIDGIGGAELVGDSVIKANDVPAPTTQQKGNLRLGRAFTQTQEAMRRYPVVCGVPVIVITAGKMPHGLDAGAIDGWRRGHKMLVALSRGIHMIAEESGHMVPIDQPAIIVEATRQMLQKASNPGAKLGTPGVACSS